MQRRPVQTRLRLDEHVRIWRSVPEATRQKVKELLRDLMVPRLRQQREAMRGEGG
jgi:hypothetical protein